MLLKIESHQRNIYSHDLRNKCGLGWPLYKIVSGITGISKLFLHAYCWNGINTVTNILDITSQEEAITCSHI